MIINYKLKKINISKYSILAERENHCDEESIVESHDERQVVVAQP